MRRDDPPRTSEAAMIEVRFGTSPGGSHPGILPTMLACFAWLPAAAGAAGPDAPAFADEPAAHAAYDRMIEAMQRARSLAFTSRYEREVDGRVVTACTYRVWLE